MRTAKVRTVMPGISDADRQREAPTEEPSANSMDPLGVAGVHISSGFVYDEFIIRLVGEKGRRIYREMRDNDATVGSMLFAIEMLLRAVSWRIEHKDLELEGSANADSKFSESEALTSVATSEEAVRFTEGVLFDDMEGTWDDFITNALSMLVFGWQYTEINWKRRKGLTDDPTTSSLFDDGLIGVSKLADRSQESLDKWDMDEHGTVFGMWQHPPNGGASVYIPMAKALHFKTRPFKDSPEGRSALRTAYRSWYFLKNIQEIESIAIERELNGLPVVYIPNELLNGTSDEAKAAVAAYTKLVRDVKFNEQGGIVLPSDPYYDAEGNPTNMKQVEFALVNADGTRAIDTDKVIKRYQSDIARTILAQFLLISQSGSSGGFAQSKSEVDVFLRAAQGFLESIAATINRGLMPKLWKINGLDSTIMPKAVPGEVSPEDLEKLGAYLRNLAAAGIVLTDRETTEHLREVAGLPKGEEVDEEDELEFDRTGEEEPGKVPGKKPEVKPVEGEA